MGVHCVCFGCVCVLVLCTIRKDVRLAHTHRHLLLQTISSILGPQTNFNQLFSSSVAQSVII